jgi:hypothetical protein
VQKSTSDGSVPVPEGLSVTRKKKKSKKDTRKSKGKPKDSHRKRTRIENADEYPSKRQMLPSSGIESSPPTPLSSIQSDGSTTTTIGIPIKKIEAIPEHNLEVFKVANILIGAEVFANKPWVVNEGLKILIQNTWTKAHVQVLDELRLYRPQFWSRDILPDNQPDSVSLSLI